LDEEDISNDNAELNSNEPILTRDPVTNSELPETDESEDYTGEIPSPDEDHL
jgi:hypothetical protein